MSLASFKPVDIVSQNTNLIVFEGRLNNVLVRSLKISPTQGTIEYFETQTNYSTIHGVPSSDKTVNLAFNYLFMLSGDTNQVTPKAKAIREGTVETYNKPNGDMLSNKMYSRGTTLYRQLDGIQEKGSFMQIDFGNDAKVNYLSLHWRLLLPFKLCKTATADEIVGFINNGRSLIYLDPTGKNAAPVRAKTLTITKATPVYRTRNAPDFVLAFSDLEVVADIGTTNEESFYVCCPICPESE
jgi:hypothetical protein